MNRTKFLIFYFVISFSLLYGQNNFEEGYIISKDGTIINGFINGSSIRKYTTKCVFKDIQDKTQVYKPDEISGFFIKDYNQLFKTVTWGDDTLFAQVLVEGVIGLSRFNFGKRNFLLSKDQVVTRVTPKTLSVRETMKMMMKDCKDKLFIDESFKLENANQLVDKIEEYHECLEKPITYKYSEKLRIKLGIRVLYDVYSLKFSDGLDYILDQNFETSKYLTPAIFAEINHPDISRHSSFVVDAAYFQRQFTGDAFGNARPTTLEFNSISASLLYRYKWFFSDFKPYVNAGPVMCFLFNKNASAEYLRADGSVNKGLIDDKTLNSNEFAIAFGFGLYYKENWFLDVRFVNGNGVLNNYILDKSVSKQFSVGYKF
jgi:hypothetical protein